MIHPDTYVKNTHKGLGLFTKRPFKRGEILWIIDDVDVKIPLAEYQNFDPLLKKKLNIYSYLDYGNRAIVPWDEGKYVNHSCAPNSTGLLQFDNISIALRDIAAEEEIVEDYNSYFGHFETFECKCGSPNCRGIVSQEKAYSPDLRLSLAEMAHIIWSLPQPLLAIESDENIEFLEILNSYSDKNK